MKERKCSLCEKICLTAEEIYEYAGKDDVSIFCSFNGNRLCIECANKIHEFYTEIKNDDEDICRYVKKTIPQKIRWEVFKRDGYKCKNCGTHIDLHCDHIYPERLGGELKMSNLQTLCQKCNKSKGVKI